jgi:uncharacterized RDD family membrane protein YckC
MEKITIGTTQNVDIEYEIGSVGDRIVATIIDLSVMMGYAFTISIILTNVASHIERTTISIVYFLVFLPVFLYTLLCEIFMNGQTPGKSVMKIKVMRMDGRQPTFGNYLMRWIMRIVDIWTFFGVPAIITCVVNGKGQRLGDMAADTLVIKLRAKQQLNSTAFEKVEATYVPVFPQAAQLTDNDASTIKQVLNLTINEAEEITEIEFKLAAKLKSYLGVHSSLGDRQFLQTLLKDYNVLSGKL